LLANNPSIGDGQGSVQEVLSCSAGQFGCIGGDASAALTFIDTLSHSGTGLETAKAFPYACGGGCKVQPACPTKAPSPYIRINSTCACIPWSELAMKVFLAKYGPLTVIVDADPWASYVSGIVRFHCSSIRTNGDHAVQIVGYGEENVEGTTIPYWTIRNSWGSDFGENGYIRLYRGENVCGITNVVNFAFADPPPKTLQQ